MFSSGARSSTNRSPRIDREGGVYPATAAAVQPATPDSAVNDLVADGRVGGVFPVRCEVLTVEFAHAAPADHDAVAPDVLDRASDNGVVLAAGAQADARGVEVCEPASLEDECRADEDQFPMAYPSSLSNAPVCGTANAGSARLACLSLFVDLSLFVRLTVISIPVSPLKYLPSSLVSLSRAHRKGISGSLCR